MADSGPVTHVSQVSSELLRKYIDGCHILHYHGLVDAYGHLSVRLSGSTFLMSRYMAPALVASADDLVVYKIEDGQPVAVDAPRGFSERFIHSEIYKAFPGVEAVVHSHSLEVVPFSISSTPLRSCFHMAGFLGTAVPVWDAATVYKNYPEHNQDMLVKNAKLGAALAQSLGSGTENGTPKHAVVLMRGHGFVATSNCIEMAVLRSVYTAQNAKVQRQAIALGGQVQVFTEREAHDTGTTTSQGAVKPWPLWVAEVTDASLYQNRV